MKIAVLLKGRADLKFSRAAAHAHRAFLQDDKNRNREVMMFLKRQHLIKTYLILCILLVSPALGDQSSKRQKLFELIHLLGVQEVSKDQYRICVKQAENYTPDIVYKQQPVVNIGSDQANKLIIHGKFLKIILQEALEGTF